MQLLSSILHSDFGSLIIKFLDSNFFVAIVGLSIFALYKIQLNDNRRDASKTIFFEIKNAEKNLKIINRALCQNPSSLPEYVYTMQVESWSKYKYLFIKDLDREEWDSITDFYINCHLIDRAISYNESFFQKKRGTDKIFSISSIY